MNPDTPENRIYIQRNRLWLLGEVIVMKLMREKPTDIAAAALTALEAERVKPTDSVEPPTPEDAAEAKEYLQKNNVAPIIEQWFQATLESKPENPIDFSIAHFKKLVPGAGDTGDAARENQEQELMDAL